MTLIPVTMPISIQMSGGAIGNFRDKADKRDIFAKTCRAIEYINEFFNGKLNKSQISDLAQMMLRDNPTLTVSDFQCFAQSVRRGYLPMASGPQLDAATGEMYGTSRLEYDTRLFGALSQAKIIEWWNQYTKARNAEFAASMAQIRKKEQQGRDNNFWLTDFLWFSVLDTTSMSRNEILNRVLVMSENFQNTLMQHINEREEPAWQKLSFLPEMLREYYEKAEASRAEAEKLRQEALLEIQKQKTDIDNQDEN